jgi:Cu/Ag efflux protein CusF
MKPSVFAAVILSVSTLLSTNALAQRHDEPGGRQHGVVRGSGIGVITSIDAPGKKITLEHETIDKLKMPPATHEFKLKNSQTLGKLKEGDKVAFELEKSGRDLKVVRLSKRN